MDKRQEMKAWKKCGPSFFSLVASTCFGLYVAEFQSGLRTRQKWEIAIVNCLQYLSHAASWLKEWKLFLYDAKLEEMGLRRLLVKRTLATKTNILCLSIHGWKVLWYDITLPYYSSSFTARIIGQFELIIHNWNVFSKWHYILNYI